MKLARKQLMETLVEHLALLQANYPRKAAMPVAIKARQCARQTLKQCRLHERRLAA